MKQNVLINIISLLSALFLFIAIFNLPIGYFSFLRVFIFSASVFFIYQAYKKSGLSFWIIVFAIIAAIFNPIMPVYLGDKGIWIPIDAVSGGIFLLYSINLFLSKSKNKA